MLTIHVSAYDKKDLPKWLAYELERYREQGYLIGLTRIKDDVIQETSYGCWDIYSYWGTPEEVQDKTSLAERVEEKLYSSDDLTTLVCIIWDILNKYAQSDIELFRNDVFEVLQGSDVAKNLLCVLIDWSDRLDIGG